MTQSIARKFGMFATESFDLPQFVQHQADRAMLDTLGAMIAGGVRFEDLQKDATRTLDKSKLMERVEVKSVPDLSSDEMRQKFPESARLTVKLKDGRIAKGFCGIAHGMPDKPLSDNDLISKFLSATSFAGYGNLFLPRLEQNPLEILEQAMLIPKRQA